MQLMYYFLLDLARFSLITENILNFDKLLPVSNLASSRSAVNVDLINYLLF